MAPRSPLAIATAAVLRLVKEEQYYHKELADQEAKIAAAESGSGGNPGGVDEENVEFMLKQQVRSPPDA